MLSIDKSAELNKIEVGLRYLSVFAASIKDDNLILHQPFHVYKELTPDRQVNFYESFCNKFDPLLHSYYMSALLGQVACYSMVKDSPCTNCANGLGPFAVSMTLDFSYSLLTLGSPAVASKPRTERFTLVVVACIITSYYRSIGARFPQVYFLFLI